MNAREFFKDVVAGNYLRSSNNPEDLRLLWNAIVSMNTIAEFLALHQLEYGELSRNQIDEQSAAIRKRFPILEDIKECAETLKHVRRHRGRETLAASSTAISTEDFNTWDVSIGATTHNLRNTLDRAYATVSKFPELTRPDLTES